MRTPINWKAIGPALLLLGSLPADLLAEDLRPRIVGGEFVDIAQAPATVALVSTRRFAETGSYRQSQFCGGTLVAGQWVVTAAHCLTDGEGNVAPPSALAVMVGASDLDQPVNQAVGVTSVIPHPNYDAPTFANDIALLRLEYDAPTTPVAIDTAAVELNQVAFIAGWGALNEGGQGVVQEIPTALQGAYVRMIPGDDCGSRFPRYEGQVDGTQVCAGRPAGGVDSCQGDSGGPLYRVPEENSGQGLTLVGVTSWGYGCANAESPGIYARVAAHSAWIRSQAGDLSSVGVSTNPPATPPATPPQNDPTPPTGTTDPVLAPNPGTTGQNESTDPLTGGFGWSLLLPLVYLIYRRRSRDSIESSTETGRAFSARPLLAGIGTIASLTLLQPLLAGSVPSEGNAVISGKLSYQFLANQPIGESRDAVVASVQEQWQSAAACTLVKTGFGANKRLYFLESCTFVNAANVDVCTQIPASIEYRFFEDALVQVGFDFEQPLKAAAVNDCINQPGTSETRPASNPAVEIRLNQLRQLIVSDSVLTSRIHLLKESL
ncbi:MAG: serine protease [Gammaproteobacteria bacterium]|nr:serine protease [Gammaproteobacteria bacterium]